MAASLAIRQKWIAGAKPAAPLFIAVGGALTVGVVVGTRHLRVNPEVLVSKHSREADLTEGTRDAKVIAREGQVFHETGLCVPSRRSRCLRRVLTRAPFLSSRRYIRDHFFTNGNLDNAQPFLMRSMYGKDKH